MDVKMNNYFSDKQNTSGKGSAHPKKGLVNISSNIWESYNKAYT